MRAVRRSILLVLALGALMIALAGVAGAQGYTPDPDVSSGTAGSGADSLASTGSDSFPWAAAGVGLVVAGGAVTVIARRRRQVHALNA